MPSLKSWKSRRVLAISSIYQDESVKESFIELALRKAEIAKLLDPHNEETENNYLELLFQHDPVIAINQRYEQLIKSAFNSSLFETGLREIINFLEEKKGNSSLPNAIINIGNYYAGLLSKDPDWISKNENKNNLIRFFLYTEKYSKAHEYLESNLRLESVLPETLFLATEIAYKENSSPYLDYLDKRLKEIAAGKNKDGVDAIRHLLLLNKLKKSSFDEIESWIHLLSNNPHSKKVDFLRIYALLFGKEKEIENKNKILEKCSKKFDLDDKKELGTFCRWLMKLNAYHEVLNYLPPLIAKTDQDLFIIRSNALIRIGALEQLQDELENSPIVHDRWLLSIEARVQSFSGKIKESHETLDRLFAFLENDSLLLRNTCAYFERSHDHNCLVYFLHKMKRVTAHKRFALNKLLQKHSNQAPLQELISWTEQLLEMDSNNKNIIQANLYYQLLSPELISNQKKLNELIQKAKELDKKFDNAESQFTLILGYLRSNLPDKAMSELTDQKMPLDWSLQRPAWRWIAGKTLEANHIDNFNPLISVQNLDSASRAERESLSIIFGTNDRI